MSISKKNAEDFVGRLKSDAQFSEELKTHSTSAEALDSYIKSEGYEFAATELDNALGNHSEAGNGHPLSDDDLKAVAGGFEFTDIFKFGIIPVIKDIVTDGPKAAAEKYGDKIGKIGGIVFDATKDSVSEYNKK